VGAPQERFAWAIGFVLALTMLYLVVIRHVIGPINLIVCAACLVLQSFDTAFGICIGCKVYNWFNKEKAQGRCDRTARHGPGGAGGRMVGMYSGEALEGVVSHAGERSHLHYVDAGVTVSGHVDDYGVAGGAVLRLPLR
jgi:hypothetical protein